MSNRHTTAIVPVGEPKPIIPMLAPFYEWVGIQAFHFMNHRH
jgi:hypothetical protein